VNIANVSVYVNDLERSIAFYRDVLGWDVTSDFPMGDSRWVTVAPKGQKTAFVLVKNFGDWSPDMVGGWSGIVLDVDDVQNTYTELTQKGVEFNEPPRSEPWGTWASFADSEGNFFGLHDNKRPNQPAEKGLMTRFLGA
jgi:predicted enzyme related to lactoylglutathione lyase